MQIAGAGSRRRLGRLIGLVLCGIDRRRHIALVDDRRPVELAILVPARALSSSCPALARSQRIAALLA